jgi:hypothetical protein
MAPRITFWKSMVPWEEISPNTITMPVLAAVSV